VAVDLLGDGGAGVAAKISDVFEAYLAIRKQRNKTVA